MNLAIWTMSWKLCGEQMLDEIERSKTNDDLLRVYLGEPGSKPWYKRV